MTTNHISTTLLTCSDCGEGNYATNGDGLWKCDYTECGHEVSWHDILPEPGERILTIDGLLHVVTD